MRKYTFALAIVLCFVGTTRAQTHSVTLTWAASPTTGVTGYNVYRLTGVCPSSPSLTAFTKLNTSPVTALTFTDSTPVSGGEYCYTITAVAPSGESGIPALAQVVIPSVTAVVTTSPPASIGVGSVN